nr:uncharacterized protein LOC131798501 [Pocillopora verrucosa]
MRTENQIRFVYFSESNVKRANSMKTESQVQTLETKFPVVDSRGKILLPPAELQDGSSTPVYANPRQALRILKRRETKRRLALSGRVKVFHRQGKRKAKSTTDDRNTSLEYKETQQMSMEN